MSNIEIEPPDAFSRYIAEIGGTGLNSQVTMLASQALPAVLWSESYWPVPPDCERNLYPRPPIGDWRRPFWTAVRPYKNVVIDRALLRELAGLEDGPEGVGTKQIGFLASLAVRGHVGMRLARDTEAWAPSDFGAFALGSVRKPVFIDGIWVPNPERRDEWVHTREPKTLEVYEPLLARVGKNDVGIASRGDTVVELRELFLRLVGGQPR